MQSSFEKACREKKILLNNKKIKPSDHVKEGDRIDLFISFSLKNIEKKTYQRYELNSLVVFENNDFLILNKPYNLATQGGTNVLDHIDKMIQNAGNYFLVHRLDKETSGLLIVAKTHKMCCYFGELFKKHLIKKTYHAIVHGVPKEGLIDAPLLNTGHNVCVASKGKEAKTMCKILKKKANKTYVELQPLTGRKHQLRVHMAHFKTPILGDRRYGLKDQEKRLYLHAQRVQFPLENGKIFEYEYPIDWEIN